MARICNDERASSGVMSGHDRKTLGLSGEGGSTLKWGFFAVCLIATMMVARSRCAATSIAKMRPGGRRCGSLPGALSLKILIHITVLFLLLKVRLEPLPTRRSTLSGLAGLANGVMDLSPRAGVNTGDEFGELARDLNHLLDRMAVLVTDLDKVLSEVVTVCTRLGTLYRLVSQQLDGVRDAALHSLRSGAPRGLATHLTVARESGAFGVLAQTLDEAGPPVPRRPVSSTSCASRWHACAPVLPRWRRRSTTPRRRRQ